MILMIVLAMLTLFAILGLSFVLYAESEAVSARLEREAQVASQADIAPDGLLNYFLGQFLYDTNNTTGVYSAMRGHSLARSLYGYNDTPGATNAVPFCGTGRLHRMTAFPNLAGNVDEYNLINYTYFQGDGFVHDPEWTGYRLNPGISPNPNQFFGVNVPYTYPDLNNMFLAAVKPDGTVLMPSFHRSWLFGPLNPSNPSWNTGRGKYQILRPRPADMGPGFPFPEDSTGDVKNLVGAPGGNDSIWMDLDYPVQTTPDGIKYKPLFAALVVDLDSRVNLNVHGNVRGGNATGTAANPTHVSNQGWGPWTVNLNYVLNPIGTTTPNAEMKNLFRGQSQQGGYPLGRYGVNQLPDLPTGLPSFPAFFPQPHFYARLDYDGCNANGGVSAPLWAAPPEAGAARFNSFPNFPAAYGSGTTASGELTNHPGIYDTFSPQGDDRYFPVAQMEPLLRMGDVGASSAPSDVASLIPGSLSADPTIRNLVTLHSVDIDRPGVAPWIWNTAAAAYNLSTPFTATQNSYVPGYPGNPGGTDNAIAFQPPSNGAQNTLKGSEFQTNDWRAAAVAALGKLDLNRPLPEYPAIGTGSWNDGGPLFQQFLVAQTARQQLAQDIFTILLEVTTGNTDVKNVAVTRGSPAYNACRWLAQLAVNIVDYIDDDDIMTPFFWNADSTTPALQTEVVFGTELPHVLINEAYADYLTVYKKVGNQISADHLDVKVWAELHNPFRTDNTLPGNGAAQLYNTATNTNVYQIFLCRPDTASVIQPNTPYYLSRQLRTPLNPWGTPQQVTVPGGASTTDVTLKTTPTGTTPAGAYSPTSFKNIPVIGPANAGAGQGAAQGYYLVGPSASTPLPPPLSGPPPQLVKTYDAPPGLKVVPLDGGVAGDMEFQVRLHQITIGTKQYQFPPECPAVVLQRLACPYLPSTATAPTSPTQTNYNPYITVDYMADINIDANMGDPPQYYKFLSVSNTTYPPPPPPGQPPPTGPRQSTGRNEPFIGHFNFADNPLWRQSQGTPQPGAVAHTFHRGNSGVINQGFNWLTHLDRQLVSPMELLNVSAFKPCELTQEFVNPAGALKPFNHRVPWFDEDIGAGQRSHRLYRFFEFAGTRGRGLGMTAPTLVVLPAAGGGGATINPPSGGGLVTVTPTSMATLTQGGAPAGIVGPVGLQPGSVVIVDAGTSTQENVRVTQVIPDSVGRPKSFQGVFLLPHGPGGTPVSITLTTMGDRIPGKININTLWDVNDPRVFQALCDAQPSNLFSTADVQNIFNQMITARMPGGAPSANDVPFLGWATGKYTAADQQFPGYGIANTVLRAQTGGTDQTERLFQGPFQDTNAANVPPAPSQTQQITHPYAKYDMLNKIANNLTTRSNVFAVWLTVGFFQVTDDTVHPIKLGAEIGRAEGRNIRHRMFAIVDRSNIATSTVFADPTFRTVPGIPLVATRLSQAVSANATTAMVDGIKGVSTVSLSSPAQPLGWSFGWSLVPNENLLIDAGLPTQEYVTIGTTVSANPPGVTCSPFQFNHAAGATVSVRKWILGNPGPKTGYNAHEEPAVVPYFSIIQ
jgi:hypothetical protein